MAFALALTVDQTDNGQSISFIDSSNWTNTADTGVTAVTISVTIGTTTYSDVVDETYVVPISMAELSWSVDVTDLGVDADTAINDGKITIEYVVTGGTGSVTLEKDVLLDYNAKYWEYTKYKDLPYSYWNGKPTYNQLVQNAALATVMVNGLQYSAEVGQTTKMNLILDTINDLREAEA